MAEMFSAIAAVCALAALVVSLFVLKRQKFGGSAPAPDTARLEQMLARQEYIVQENARATRDFLDFMAKQQGGNLRGIQEKLEELIREELPALREKAAKRGLANVRAQLGDATCLRELPDGAFDVVLCLGPLYHLPPDEREIGRRVGHADQHPS